MSGAEGELRAGGRWAARLGRWSGEIEPAGGAIHARVVQADAWWIERGPHTLALRVGASEWVWRGAEVESLTPGRPGQAGQITLRVSGEREVRRYG